MFSKSSPKDRVDQGQAQGRNTEIIIGNRTRLLR